MTPHGPTSSACILCSPVSKVKKDFSKNWLEVIIVQNCINVQQQQYSLPFISTARSLNNTLPQTSSRSTVRGLDKYIQQSKLLLQQLFLMKGVITAVCAMTVCVHSQFNVEIDRGFRFGILGGEVVNIGGNNKDQPFQTGSWPADVLDLIPLPQGPNPQPPQPKSSSPPSITRNSMSQKVSRPKKLSRNPQMMPPKIRPPQINPRIAQKPLEQTKPVEQINKPSQIVINELEVTKNQRNYEHKEKNQVQQEEIPEKVKEKREMDLLMEKQDERLAKFIKLMPQSQKQHLRAIATDKTQV